MIGCCGGGGGGGRLPKLLVFPAENVKIGWVLVVAMVVEDCLPGVVEPLVDGFVVSYWLICVGVSDGG